MSGTNRSQRCRELHSRHQFLRRAWWREGRTEIDASALLAVPSGDAFTATERGGRDEVPEFGEVVPKDVGLDGSEVLPSGRLELLDILLGHLRSSSAVGAGTSGERRTLMRSERSVELPQRQTCVSSRKRSFCASSWRSGLSWSLTTNGSAKRVESSKTASPERANVSHSASTAISSIHVRREAGTDSGGRRRRSSSRTWRRRSTRAGCQPASALPPSEAKKATHRR